VEAVITWLMIGSLLMAPNLPTKYVTPSMFFEARYYRIQPQPIIHDAPTPTELYPYSYIAVNTEYTISCVFDIWVGMQGWTAADHSFVRGHGGATYGARLRLTEGMELGYTHFSCHMFDHPGRCGNYDYLYLRIGWNMFKEKTGLF